MPSESQLRCEECRHAVRGYLAERAACAFPMATIRKRVNQLASEDFSEDEIAAALAFLSGEAQVSTATADGTLYFQATSKGVQS